VRRACCGAESEGGRAKGKGGKVDIKEGEVCDGLIGNPGSSIGGGVFCFCFVLFLYD
jgi:hypothetical protein